ncbi:ankyrin repeat-containing domain protein [Microdochium trichocladiopsis]|uniref:Ankyrin repeat-containing domain protein n=1 Tax=Microdochium trichocladiopsis TaxID=1682393 RepID=A0A9P8XVK1_9PEZI|nr:ankyrin repeat-containing domain protein [Microdochium trichocladiopsis]KAH7020752.1 ankyrin repeat-containing domain protein [Microdochium trichocladiopsis]
MATLSQAEVMNRLFEATLDALADIDAFSGPSSPTSFIVYAHDPDSGDDGLGPGYSDIVKTFIAWLRRLRTRTLSDRHPSALFGHETRLGSDESACRDILENQFCLLPRRATTDSEATGIERVDTVVVCGTPRLKSYCEHPSANEYMDAIKREYAENAALPAGELRRKILDNVLNAATSRPGFHHVLTEIAFLELRRQHNPDAHGIVLVSLEGGMIDYFRFIQSTNLQLGINPLSTSAELQSRFFKLLRAMYTTSDGAITAYEEAYTDARHEVEKQNGNIPSRDLDNLLEKSISRARRDLANLENAGLRDLSVRRQLAELGNKAYADLEERRNKVLGALPTIPYRDRKDRNPERVAGTCRWFTKHEKFRAWHSSESGGILWVTAYPGCGKSVLLKHLVDTVLVAPNSAVCYFFFKDDFEDQKSIIGALRCLLHQLLLQRPELLTDNLIQKFKRDQQLLSSASNLWDLLHNVARGVTVGNLVIVIDALDECVYDDRQVLMRLLVKWSESASTSRVKILISSRLYNDISRGFHGVGSEIHLSAENDSELEQISGEIDLVITHKLRNTAAYLGLEKKQQDILYQELTKVANKTYLWAYLVQDEIDKMFGTDPKSLRAAVQNLPRGVDAAYEKILSRSGQRENVMRMLSIIIAAAEPLNLLQLAQAWALTSEISRRDELEIMSETHMLRTIRGLCGLFVIVVEGRAYLLHQTAREFLLARQQPLARGVDQNGSWKGSVVAAEAELIMARICLRFFQLYEWPAWGFSRTFRGPRLIDSKSHDTCPCREPLQAHKRDCFAIYAFEQWVEHVLDGQQPGGKILAQQAAELCAQSRHHFVSTMFSEGKHRYYTPSDESLPSPLMVASMLGVLPAVELLSQRPGAELDRVDWLGSTALGWAALCKHADVVRVLVERGADYTTKDRWDTPVFTRVVELGDEALVELLLDKGADPNVADERGYPPLFSAKSTEVVSLLLKHGADIKFTNRNGCTALNYACETRPHLVRILLEAGADPSVTDEKGWTPLIRCCGRPLYKMEEQDFEREWLGTIELLLGDCRVDVNAHDHSGDTALYLACQAGRALTVEILLKHGAQTHGRDLYAAIYAAIHTTGPARNAAAIVRMLLHAGVDITSDYFHGKPALHYAAKLGHQDIVRLLLDHGADIDQADLDGRTPLMVAVLKSRMEAVQMLLSRRADTGRLDTKGNSVVCLAIQGRKVDIVEMLLDSVKDVDAVCGQGLTPLVEAALLQRADMIQSLVRRGATINHTTEGGITPLIAAVMAGWPEGVELLLRSGADSNYVGRGGRTALATAANHRELESLWTFLAGVSHGKISELPAPSSFAERRKADIIRILLENGADPEG